MCTKDNLWEFVLSHDAGPEDRTQALKVGLFLSSIIQMQEEYALQHNFYNLQF